MGDMLAEGNAWLEGKRREYMVQPIVYKRGTYELSLDATLGRTSGERADHSGLSVRVTERDFLIAADELIDSLGMPLEPRQGDRIVVELNGVFEEFIVNPLQGDNAWVWSDPYHTVRRVHTKWDGQE